MSTLEKIRALSELTSWQSGYFTTAQAKQQSVSPATLTRFANAGVIERIQRGVYRMTAAPSNEFEYETIFTTWLSTAPDKHATERISYNPHEVIAAGPLALKLHDDAILHLDRYDFVSATRRQSKNAKIHYRQRYLTRDEVTVVRGIPAMTIERAIADLVELNVDLSTIEAVAEAQLFRGTTTILDVTQTLTSLPDSNPSEMQQLVDAITSNWKTP